jgi:hypothetical protein
LRFTAGAVLPLSGDGHEELPERAAIVLARPGLARPGSHARDRPELWPDLEVHPVDRENGTRGSVKLMQDIPRRGARMSSRHVAGSVPSDRPKDATKFAGRCRFIDLIFVVSTSAPEKDLP